MSFDEIFDLTAGVYFNFYNIRVPSLVCYCVFPGVFLSSRVSIACPVAMNFIMQVHVKATTTTSGFTCKLVTVDGLYLGLGLGLGSGPNPINRSSYTMRVTFLIAGCQPQ